MYTEVRKLNDRVKTQDECITWLLIQLRTTQKRVTKLEAHHASITANKVRAAYEGMEEFSDLEQRGDLPVQETGDQEIGHPAPTAGR
jgi:hypothetical protein